MRSVIDLTPAQRRSILRLIEAHLPHTDVWAYGSRVKWTSQPASDLDLVAFAGPEQRRQVVALREAFEESDLPFRVDLLVWDEIPEAFQEEIDAEHAALVEWTSAGQSWCTLGDLAHITMGQSPPGETVNGKVGMPLLNGPTEFGPHHPTPRQYTLDPRRVARPGDLLFCVRGSTTGRMNWADREYAIGRGIAAIRHKTRESLQPFVRAVIESRLSTLLSGATGSVFRNVSATDLTGLPIPDLPLRRQTEIANILGTLDDKIELNRRMCDTLQATTQALFREWFVDFGPVHARREGRGISLPSRIVSLFPDTIVDSPLGKVPTGWKVFLLSQLADRHTTTIAPSAIPETAIEHFSIPAYDSGQQPSLDRSATIKSSKFVLPSGAILLSKLNPRIPRAWLPGDPSTLLQVCSTEFLVFTPRHPATRSLLYSLFSDSTFQVALRSMATGTSASHQRVPSDALTQNTLLAGTPALFQTFDSIAAPLLARIVRLRAESSAIAFLRDSLLPKLVSSQMGTSLSSAQGRATCGREER